MILFNMPMISHVLLLNNATNLSLKCRNVFKRINNYAPHNGLILNLSKTKILFFGDNPNMSDILFHNTKVEIVSCFKYLGFKIDNNVKFNH